MHFYFFSLIVVVLLTGCGSGGGTNDLPASQTQEVLVNAGVNLSVSEGESGQLSGAASGGTPPYTYTWTAPEAIALSQTDNSNADASFVAPTLIQSTSYTLTLEARDSNGSGGQKSITLTVEPINLLPVAQITANNLAEYAALSYPVNTEVTLDASRSFDEDAPRDLPEIAAYNWQQLAGSDVLQGANTTSSSLSFITPVTIEPMQAEFLLTVTDQEGASASSQISLSLLGERGTLPLVNAGKAIAVFSGEQLSLSGSVSSLSPNAAPFALEWQHDFSEAIVINNERTLGTYALAPIVSEPTPINFTLTAIDSFSNSAADTQTFTVYPPQKGVVNDSGVTLSTSSNLISENYAPDYAGQDAQYGADRQQVTGLIDKIGHGQAGFDFTKLNANGDPIGHLEDSFSCVRDNTSGLVWEVKSISVSEPGANSHLFTWYSEEENGGFEGELNLGSERCALTSGQCNTQAYVDYVNSVGLCGFFDWRLPNVYELRSIVHYGKSNAPFIDDDFFANALPNDSASISLWYWTSQSSADGVSEELARTAWAIDFGSGLDSFLNKANEAHIRLVRAGRNTQ
ncbi:DUF1566 domain-containing protein [Ningiella sp. W23]|uniref:Lcl C-terminal domain-containing protein n=1 Tax=Ningiella sp. W23 TaxID=3023715 RepID=UPI0037576C35